MKRILKRFFSLFIAALILLPLSVNAASNGITLDGYFDDWEDKPITYLRYPSVTPEQVHQLREYTDNNYLYLYIKMGTRGGQGLSYYVIECSFNDSNTVQKHLQIAPDRPQTGRVTIFDMDGGYTAVSTDGYIVRGNNSDGKTSDQAEFKIPLSEFRTQGAVGIENVKLRIPDLGDRYAAFQVGSTGPYFSVLICSIIAISGIFMIKRRNSLRAAI
ncbi:hypothetical protein NL50_04080 [Clostridium acetobutylicum]|nr:hypothetical protein NL50_04080 [Clostridium acetobutylicum]